VPDTVIPPDDIVAAFTRPSQLFRPLGERVVAVDAGNDPSHLDHDGRAYPAGVFPRMQSDSGPVADCGHRVDEDGATISLSQVDAEPLGETWWGSIAYLANASGSATLTMGDQTTEVSVRRGLHTFVFQGEGDPEDAELATTGDVVMCVSELRVGDLVAVK